MKAHRILSERSILSEIMSLDKKIQRIREIYQQDAIDLIEIPSGSVLVVIDDHGSVSFMNEEQIDKRMQLHPD